MIKDPENIHSIIVRQGTGTGLEIGVVGGLWHEDTFKFGPYEATVPEIPTRIDVDTFEIEVHYRDGTTEKGIIRIDKMETYPDSDVIFEFKNQRLVGRKELFVKEQENGELKKVKTKLEAY